MQPMMVMFFQSEANLDENLMFVFSSAASRLTLMVFLAVMGDIPQSEPCLTTSRVGSVSEATVAPFWASVVFSLANASSILRLTVRSGKRYPNPLRTLGLLWFILCQSTTAMSSPL
jgi:hypothetical protein